MAPVSAASRPRAQRRDNKDLYNGEIGVVGRRTQQTLPPLGPRDDYGLEPTDKLFSSAAKSRISSIPSPDENQRQDADTKRKIDLSSESMDLVNSRRIIVTENQRQTLQRKTPLKPTRHRPTNIGGTPVRGSSVGLSSPHRPTTPTRQPLSPSKQHRDYSLPSVEHSPGKSQSVSNSSAKRIRSSRAEYKGLSRSPQKPYNYTPHLPIRGLSSSPRAEPEVYVDTFGQDAEDDGAPFETEIDVSNIDPTLPSPTTATKTPASARTSRLAMTPRTVQPVTQEAEDSLDFPEDSAPQDMDEPPELPVDDPTDLPEATIDEPAEPEAAAEPPKPKRGRPRKGEKKSKPKPEPKRKDGFKKPAAPGNKNPSNVRVRSETPFDDTSHTRSGRMVYKPLEYWRGERVKLAVIRDSQSDAIIESVDEIIRMEDVTPIKRTRQPSEPPAKGKKRKRTVFQDGPEDDEDDREEDWERDEGVVNGPVRVWDEEMGTTINEERDQELAFAGSHIETREVPNAEFRYAKTLTMPFFGTGMVELPPKGYKRVKNSRKMHMVFFVHYGKVCVEVAGTMFTITKGGVWQVPRGNFYAITNETEHSAMIFFAQGCEIPASVVNPPERQLAQPEPA